MVKPARTINFPFEVRVFREAVSYFLFPINRRKFTCTTNKKLGKS
mgnify:CR=1 FL=1